MTVSVTNTGSCYGEEVVQLYVRRVDDASGPLKSLRGFKRVGIQPGETVKVTFKLDDEVFLSWSEDAQDMVPVHGEWELMVGGSSDALQSVERIW